MKYFFTLALLFVLSITSLWAQNSILVPIDTLKISLNKNNSYARSDANNEYFVFQNLSTQNLHVYSFASKKEHIIPLKKGRGPNEYLQIGSIIIDKTNTIYLLDTNGFKLIRLNVNGNYDDDIVYEIKAHFINLKKYQNDIYASTAMDIHNGSYYHKIKLDNNSADIISLHPKYIVENPIKFKNPFNFYGRSDVNQNHIVHAHIYSSKFSIYPLDTTKNMIEINYDEYIIDDETTIIGEGTVAILPPAKVLVKLENMFVHPTNSYNVYINAEGRTKNKSYFKNMIYKYDLNKEEFSDSYDLGFTPSELMRYKNKLYVIPKFEDGIKHKGIYVYEIVD